MMHKTVLTKLLDCVPQRLSTISLSSPSSLTLKPYIWEESLQVPHSPSQKEEVDKGLVFPTTVRIDDLHHATIWFDFTTLTENEEGFRVQQQLHPLYRIFTHDHSTTSSNSVTVSLNFDVKYRTKMVSNPTFHQEFHQLFYHLIETVMTFSPITTTSSHNLPPSKKILLLGYQWRAHTSKFKQWNLLPGVPFCATHCDVTVPRKGKRDKLLMVKQRGQPPEKTKRQMEFAQWSSDSSSDDDESSSSVKRVKRTKEEEKEEDKYDRVCQQQVLLVQPIQPMPTTLEEQKQESSPLPNNRPVRIVQVTKTVKRRDYSMVYDGSTSSLLFAKTFYRKMCKWIAAEMHPLHLTDQVKNIPFDHFHSYDVANGISSNENVERPHFCQCSYDREERMLAKFLLEGGFDEMYVTLPRMHRIGLASIANVMINFFMELPAQSIVFDFRLLEHCDIESILSHWIQEQCRERIDSLFTLGDVSNWTAMFPLLYISPSVCMFPRVFVSAVSTGNVPFEITEKFHSIWNSTYVHFQSRRPFSRLLEIYSHPKMC